MEVRPTEDQEALIRHALEAGRIAQPEDAVREALAMWEERERKRIEILALIDEGEESLANGDVIAITEESMAALAADIKRRGRAWLEAEAATKR
jgi:Arc/MetJ-type ribon-helix-helix transcriptional regulator